MQEKNQGKKNSVVCERIFGDVTQKVIIVLWRGKMSWKKGVKVVSLMLALSTMSYGGWWLWKNYPRDYWITDSSNMTHNYTCHHYARSKGSMSKIPSGKNCKVCLGAELPRGEKP